MANPNLKFNLPFNIGIPDTPPADLEPNMKGLFVIVYNGFLQIQQAIHQYLGVGQQLQTLWSQLRYDQTLHPASMTRFYAKAFQPIPYGNAVNLFVDAGVLKIRLANATNNTKPCHGFCTTTTGIATDAYGEVILLHGLLTAVSGIVLGTRYFLSTTDGLVTAVAPVAAGNIEQALGIAMDSSALLFDFNFHFIQH